MKILLTTDWYAPAVNGVVTSVLNLRRELRRLGHEVRVLTLAESGRTTVEDGVTALGSVDMGRVYPGARLRSAAASAEIKELIRWKPDIVHSQCEFSTFFLAVKIAHACGAPLVHTYHTVYEDYTHYLSPKHRWGKGLARGLTRIFLAKTDAVIAPTEKVRTLLQGYGVEKTIDVVPTGIDLSRFALPVPEEEKRALRAELGIPEGNKILLSVGRLAKEKNIEELLECRAQLPGGTTLLLVGGGPERPHLEQAAKELGLEDGAVVFAGMIDPQQVPRYYALGDVFVSASTSETQGLTYIEALAAGLPAVCRADACLEGVLIDGQNGWQYRTPEAFVQDVSALLQDEGLREAFSVQAQRTAEEYSAAHFAARVLRCYRRTLADRTELPAAQKGGEVLWQN